MYSSLLSCSVSVGLGIILMATWLELVGVMGVVEAEVVAMVVVVVAEFTSDVPAANAAAPF